MTATNPRHIYNPRFNLRSPTKLGTFRIRSFIVQISGEEEKDVRPKRQTGLLHRRHPRLLHQAPKSLVQSRILNRPFRFRHRPHNLPGRLLRPRPRNPKGPGLPHFPAHQIPKSETRLHRRKPRLCVRRLSASLAVATGRVCVL